MWLMWAALHTVMKNEIVAGITVQLFLPFNTHGLYGVNAYIELVPNKQYQWIDVNDDHQYNDGTNRAI